MFLQLVRRRTEGSVGGEATSFIVTAGQNRQSSMLLQGSRGQSSADLDVSLLKLDVSGSEHGKVSGALPPSLKHNISFSLPLYEMISAFR